MRIEADIDELIKLVSSVTEAYTTAFFLADNQKRELKLWHFYSLSDNVIANASIPFGVGPIGWVAENQRPFDLSKFSDRDSGLLKLYSKSEEIKSFFAVPVMNEGLLEGVLCVDSKRAFVFANKDQKLLTLFADQFADLVNNLKVKRFVDTEASDVAFLHSFSSRIASTSDLESILHLTINSIVKLMGGHSCFLSLRTDGEDGEFRIELAYSNRSLEGTTFSDQDGLSGRVIRDKEPYLLTNRKGDFGSDVFATSKSVGRFKSFLGVPLLTEDEVLGLICLVDSDENAFNQRDLRVVSIVASIAALAIANTRAQEGVRNLSTVADGLTGLYNFSGFQERLEKTFQETSRKHRPLSLIIIDIDDFGEINNNLGYVVGNTVLKKLAQLIMDLVVDDSITAARYGADEFALVLPSIAKDRAVLIAENLHSALEGPVINTSKGGLNISVSIGVSSFPQDSKSCNDLMNNAVRALSSAKSQGGGRSIRNNIRSVGTGL